MITLTLYFKPPPPPPPFQLIVVKAGFCFDYDLKIKILKTVEPPITATPPQRPPRYNSHFFLPADGP